MEQSESTWKCGKCGVRLVLKKTRFDYLGRIFTHEVPCCPSCGNVFITRDLAEGRMSEVEQQLEDK